MPGIKEASMNIQINSIRLLFALILSISFTSVCSALQDSKQDQKLEIDLWPTGLPAGAAKLDPKKIDELKSKQAKDTRGLLMYVDSPTLTVYPAPKDKHNGCAIVICPGGGYNILAWQHEGVELAKWFNSIGVTAFVLKYRVPRRDPEKIHWEPMQDVQRAIRLVRHKAKDWNIDPNRIGTLGFSAGGHLTVMSGTQYNTKSYEPVDEADEESCRPDFMCPIYAAYLGEKYRDNVAELGSLVNVTKDTPPTFLAVTADDSMRGAQSALLFAELNKNKVTAEVHVYSKGGHGYGIRDDGLPVNQWHHQLEAWLKQNGFLVYAS
jgi:acetyl esterase/lipase